MEFGELSSTIFDGLKPNLENHNGLQVFARERAKFEGWLKVELCAVLVEAGIKPLPEVDRIDITFEDWAIELKTMNTNIRYSGVRNKHRPITNNVSGLIKDIRALSLTDVMNRFQNRSVLFVVFPITHDNQHWQQYHYPRMLQELADIKHVEFSFKSGIPGVLYFGLCK